MKRQIKWLLGGLGIILVLTGVWLGIGIYNVFLKPNVNANIHYAYVKSGSSYEDLIKQLEQQQILINTANFITAAKRMDLRKKIHAGRYAVNKNTSNRTLVNLIKSGNQTPVNLLIQNMRTRQNLAGYLGKNLEADSAAFIAAIDSPEVAARYGLTKETLYTMFIPDKYEMYWNVGVSGFLDRMYKEYNKFWTAERIKKASALNLNKSEVYILASIVDAEALHDSEMPRVAGLYLNRLQKGIRLQADPTVIFAADDFTIKRVTNKLLATNSDYNTYLHAGLPPGPIMMPSRAAINAVLEREENNYLYMCAKADFSGYHAFAVTQAEHEKNAKLYREALNLRKIYK